MNAEIAVDFGKRGAGSSEPCSPFYNNTYYIIRYCSYPKICMSLLVYNAIIPRYKVLRLVPNIHRTQGEAQD